LFGSCIIHILNTGVLKFEEKKFSRQRVKEYSMRVISGAANVAVFVMLLTAGNCIFCLK
jgi:histone acetyltransferase (RNA polymerase elongator complex component)